MNIHFVGIEGVSMRALARIMESGGATVTGSDISISGYCFRQNELSGELYFL